MQVGFEPRGLAPVLTVLVACIAWGCSDSDAPPTPGTTAGAGGSGGTGTGGSGGTGGTGAGGSGGTGAAPGDAARDVTSVRDGAGASDRTVDEAGSGACTNAADQGVIGNTVKFEQDITDCGTTCFFLPGTRRRAHPTACAAKVFRRVALLVTAVRSPAEW